MTEPTLKCPICVADLQYTSEPDKKLPCYNFNDLTIHWRLHHVDRVIRRYYARSLFNVDTVQKSKIKAKIEELRKILTDNSATIPYDRQWVVVSVAIGSLEDLLSEEPNG